MIPFFGFSSTDFSSDFDDNSPSSTSASGCGILLCSLCNR